MPGLDGAEICRELRTRKNKPYTYLILLSSKESKQDIVQGLASGADDYLTKPFDAEELKARLRAGQRILDLEDRLVEARESMRFQATHDLLTSLWNRGVIAELLLREVHRSRRERNCTAVMVCDIDHFKSVNDSLGHAAGDDVLREVSRRLRTSVRSYDMVGRNGGKEFLVVLNKCDAASAAHHAETSVNPFFPGPSIWRLRNSRPASVGASLSPVIFLAVMLRNSCTTSIWPFRQPKPRVAIASASPSRSLLIGGFA
jgi:PleD family two-component response regulator